KRVRLVADERLTRRLGCCRNRFLQRDGAIYDDTLVDALQRRRDAVRRGELLRHDAVCQRLDKRLAGRILEVRIIRQRGEHRQVAELGDELVVVLVFHQELQEVPGAGLTLRLGLQDDRSTAAE